MLHLQHGEVGFHVALDELPLDELELLDISSSSNISIGSNGSRGFTPLICFSKGGLRLSSSRVNNDCVQCHGRGAVALIL